MGGDELRVFLLYHLGHWVILKKKKRGREKDESMLYNTQILCKKSHFLYNTGVSKARLQVWFLSLFSV